MARGAEAGGAASEGDRPSGVDGAGRKFYQTKRGNVGRREEFGEHVVFTPEMMAVGRAGRIQAKKETAKVRGRKRRIGGGER